MANNIHFYGTNWCPDCKRAKKFLGEHQIRYEYINIDENEEGMQYVEEINNGMRIIPTIEFPDGDILVEPSNAELAEKLGLQTEPENNYYPLIVVGGGPAGLTAALYAAREGIDVLVLERSVTGGQAAITEQLDNVPGFPEGIRGATFAQRLHEQAETFGVEVVQAIEVERIRKDGQYFIVTARGTDYCADAVLLATGATYRRLGVPGEEDYIGVNVHFCATCDGAFYRDKEVVVVGGGNSAAEGVATLLSFTDDVTMLVRAGDLSGASQNLHDKIHTLEEEGRVTVRYNTEVTEMRGNGRLQTLIVRDVESDEEVTFEPDGVFVFIGLSPVSGLIVDMVDTDDADFISTDDNLMTSVDGLFAAGDVRAGSTKQVTSATGEGATAALMIRNYLRSK